MKANLQVYFCTGLAEPFQTKPQTIGSTAHPGRYIFVHKGGSDSYCCQWALGGPEGLSSRRSRWKTPPWFDYFRSFGIMTVTVTSEIRNRSESPLDCHGARVHCDTAPCACSAAGSATVKLVSAINNKKLLVMRQFPSSLLHASHCNWLAASAKRLTPSCWATEVPWSALQLGGKHDTN